jgi:hypothetical protein
MAGNPFLLLNLRNLAISAELSYTVKPIARLQEDMVRDRQLPITCPICGRKNEFPLEVLSEGYELQCPHCNVKLTLHGHMLEEIQCEIAKLEQKE